MAAKVGAHLTELNTTPTGGRRSSVIADRIRVVLKSYRTCGSSLESFGESGEAGIRVHNVHYAFAFVATNGLADTTGFFSTVKSVFFVPYQFGGWL